MILANNKNIEKIVSEEIDKLGPNADLNNINVSGVTILDRVFSCVDFHGDVSQWDVSNVYSMESTFEASVISADLSNWDVSGVRNINRIFFRARIFGNISNWNFKSLSTGTNAFVYSSISSNLGTWFPDAYTFRVATRVLGAAPLHGTKYTGKFLAVKYYNGQVVISKQQLIRYNMHIVNSEH